MSSQKRLISHLYNEFWYKFKIIGGYYPIFDPAVKSNRGQRIFSVYMSVIHATDSELFYKVSECGDLLAIIYRRKMKKTYYFPP